MKLTRGEKVFSVANYIFLTLFALITVYPFWDVLRVSLSTAAEANSTTFRFFPSEISWEGYKNVIANEFIWMGYKNTIIRVVVGVSIKMALTILTAYPLSKKSLPHRNLITSFIIFTMFFNAGMIPAYLNIKSLNLYNTLWALVLPTALDSFNMFIMRNFFMGIPEELEESARIDGANTLQILLKVILPVSMPIIMTVFMWSTVQHWNSWFDCLIYIQDYDKYTLSAILRKIVIDATPQFDNMPEDGLVNLNVEVIKCATIIVSTLPIMAIYPFVQKHFVRGVMVGSLKG